MILVFILYVGLMCLLFFGDSIICLFSVFTGISLNWSSLIAVLSVFAACFLIMYRIDHMRDSV